MSRGAIAVLRFKLLLCTGLVVCLIAVVFDGGYALKAWSDHRNAPPPPRIGLCTMSIQEGWSTSRCVEPDGTVVVSRILLSNLGSPVTYGGSSPATRTPTPRR